MSFFCGCRLIAAVFGSIPRILLCLSLFITKGVGSSSPEKRRDVPREFRDWDCCNGGVPLEALPFRPDLSRSKAVGTGSPVSCPITVHGETGDSL